MCVRVQVCSLFFQAGVLARRWTRKKTANREIIWYESRRAKHSGTGFSCWIFKGSVMISVTVQGLDCRAPHCFSKWPSVAAGEQGLIHAAGLNYALYCEYYRTFKCEACSVCSACSPLNLLERECQNCLGRAVGTNYKSAKQALMLMQWILGQLCTPMARITPLIIWRTLYHLVQWFRHLPRSKPEATNSFRTWAASRVQRQTNSNHLLNFLSYIFILMLFV